MGRPSVTAARRRCQVRDDLFLASKAYPYIATRLTRSWEARVKRLETNRLAPYLLRWRGNVPLAETVEAMRESRARARCGVGTSVTSIRRDGGTRRCRRSGVRPNHIVYNLTAEAGT